MDLNLVPTGKDKIRLQITSSHIPAVFYMTYSLDPLVFMNAVSSVCWPSAIYCCCWNGGRCSVGGGVKLVAIEKGAWLILSLKLQVGGNRLLSI